MTVLDKHLGAATPANSPQPEKIQSDEMLADENLADKILADENLADKNSGGETTVDKTLRKPRELIAAGLADPSEAAALQAVAQRYAIAITPEMAKLIDPTDPDDPIARQFIPDARELHQLPQERADPIGDAAHSPVEGIVHRYPTRALLKLVTVCPVYCRFCFRREMVGPGRPQTLSAKTLEAALSYIAGHSEIWEVILSGGDPFTLSPRRIRDLTTRLAAIPHVKIIRWHSRVPVVDPAHITDEFAAALRSANATTYVVLHANHPRELGAEAQAAIDRIIDAGVPMLSQSVLLKGVNNDADCLAELMRRFVELRIKPYYLHHCDLAPGTSHFRTSINEGQALMRELRQLVSGHSMPSYVLDIPGGHGKVPIGPAYIEGATAGSIDDTGAAGDPDEAPITLRDPTGNPHLYPPAHPADDP